MIGYLPQLFATLFSEACFLDIADLAVSTSSALGLLACHVIFNIGLGDPHAGLKIVRQTVYSLS